MDLYPPLLQQIDFAIGRFSSAGQLLTNHSHPNILISPYHSFNRKCHVTTDDIEDGIESRLNPSTLTLIDMQRINFRIHHSVRNLIL